MELWQGEAGQREFGICRMGGAAGRWRKWRGGVRVELTGREVGRPEKFGRDEGIGERR